MREIPTSTDSGEIVLLRDDGTNGDEKANDGIFSALSVVDFDAQMKQEQRIVDAQKANNGKLTEGFFDGRQLISEKTLTPVLTDVFRPFIPIPITPHPIASAVDPARSLIIRDASVVTDPTRTINPCTNVGNANGAWTFNKLMTEMANQPVSGLSPSAFTLRWLQNWSAPQSINGWTVPSRTSINTRIINPWPKLPSGELDMTKSPFKLVAIVNRLDLGKGNSPYSSAGAGELRFVFAAADRTSGCTIPTLNPFLVIFEFGVPKTGCPTVKTWAQGWAGLSTTVLGSGFNSALEALTSQVVLRNAAPTKPNGSAINQVRTNDFLLGGNWELREFRIFSSGSAIGHLVETTTVLTPGNPLNNTTTLASFINTNATAIVNGTYTVPLTWPTTSAPFLGANPQAPSPSFIWNAPGVTTNPRHKFSLNTCNGCHAGEVNTNFTHIGAAGNLSPFLSGPLTKIDPVDGITSRTFNEILMRQQHLDSTANQSCLVRVTDVALSASAFSH